MLNKVTTWVVKQTFKQFTPVKVPKVKGGTIVQYKSTLPHLYPQMFTQPGFKGFVKNNVTQYINRKVTLTGKPLTNNTVVTNPNISNHKVTTTKKLPIITIKNHIYKWVYQYTTNKPQYKSNPLQGVKLTPQQHKQLTTYVNSLINGKHYVITKHKQPNNTL